MPPRIQPGAGSSRTVPTACSGTPIYAAVLYFVWAAALDHHSLPAIAAAALTTTGAAVRMYADEQLLAMTYPEYTAYGARTARVIPFVF
jgi:protein-S-isoprenylcysteine O-methyltransferase Ste14